MMSSNGRDHTTREFPLFWLNIYKYRRGLSLSLFR